MSHDSLWEPLTCSTEKWRMRPKNWCISLLQPHKNAYDVSYSKPKHLWLQITYKKYQYNSTHDVFIPQTTTHKLYKPQCKLCHKPHVFVLKNGTITNWANGINSTAYVCELEHMYPIIIKWINYGNLRYHMRICETRRNPGPKIEGVASTDAAHLCSVLSLSKPPS